MLEIKNKVREINDCQPGAIPEGVIHSEEPVVLRGLVNEWPLVRAGLGSDREADGYLRKFYSGRPVVLYKAAAEKQGRFFYSEDCSALDFETGRASLDAVLDEIRQASDKTDAPAYYVGSTTVDTCLPGFRADNDLNLNRLNPLVSIWLGNRSRISAHFDAPNNIACCAVGHRRFTLFPPNQVENLYVGPLHFTPSGQSISMVDFHDPDFERFPKFATALANAQVAELKPGDAIFVPSMWWHHVEGLDSFNVLINYWWRLAPGHADPPTDVLHHAMLSIRELPDHEKQAWRRLFDHYVFGAQENKYDHIPESARGFLDPLDETRARQLRSWLLNKLNR